MGAGTGDPNAGDRPNVGTDTRLDQIDSNVGSKCHISRSPHFSSSINAIATSLGIDETELDKRIVEFITYKMSQGCSVPFTSYGEDKSSGTNLKGEPIRPYQDDNHWHCHLSISSPGDPMIAYRMIAAGHIQLICITTHKLCFAQRNDFIRQHADEFPRTMKRRPSLGRPKS
jgi:hypothetical protein